MSLHYLQITTASTIDISVISAKEFTESILFFNRWKINKNSFIIQSYTLKIKKSMEAQLKIRQGPEKWGM